MGAWGPGSFQNDAALDWFEGEFAGGGAEVIVELLEEVAQADEIDADLGSAAVAAAECVAIAFGNPSSELEDDMRVSVGEHAEEITNTDDITELAQRALAAVAEEGSELAQLWAESEGADDWEAALSDLEGRLRK
jgi:hypothetical protein